MKEVSAMAMYVNENGSLKDLKRADLGNSFDFNGIDCLLYNGTFTALGDSAFSIEIQKPFGTYKKFIIMVTPVSLGVTNSNSSYLNIIDADIIKDTKIIYDSNGYAIGSNIIAGNSNGNVTVSYNIYNGSSITSGGAMGFYQPSSANIGPRKACNYDLNAYTLKLSYSNSNTALSDGSRLTTIFGIY